MINTERLILLPSDLHMLESIVNQNWEQLSAQIDGYAVENNGWYEDFQVFIWMRDLAQDGALETNWWNYLILHKADRKLIGTCGFKGAPGPDGVVEIGYEIAEIYRNQKLATEAASALCNYAFQFETVKSICAHTLAEECHSVQLLRTLGFVYTREMLDIEDGKIWEWVKIR